MDDPLGVDPLGAIEAPGSTCGSALRACRGRMLARALPLLQMAVRPHAAVVLGVPRAEPAAPEPVAAEPEPAEPEPEPAQPEPEPKPEPEKFVIEWVDGQNVDPEKLAAKQVRVRVDGYGEGVVKEFKKSRMFGASAHIVVFDEKGEQTVYLERNGNGKTPFKIQVKKPAPKSKSKPKARTSSAGRGFQTFGDMTADASGDGSEPERFREAIKSGDLATVESLIEKIDLNNPDKLGNTSLHQACLFNQAEMIQMFLAKGASHTVQNKIGETPVKVAQPFMQQKILSYVDSGTW